MCIRDSAQNVAEYCPPAAIGMLALVPRATADGAGGFAVGTTTWAEAAPTAAVVASREIVASPVPFQNDQPLVTSVSKPGLVDASGVAPVQIIWYMPLTGCPSQPVSRSRAEDLPVERSTAYSSYHHAMYCSFRDIRGPLPNAPYPSPRVAVPSPSRTLRVLSAV